MTDNKCDGNSEVYVQEAKGVEGVFGDQAMCQKHSSGLSSNGTKRAHNEAMKKWVDVVKRRVRVRCHAEEKNVTKNEGRGTKRRRSNNQKFSSRSACSLRFADASFNSFR